VSTARLHVGPVRRTALAFDFELRCDGPFGTYLQSVLDALPPGNGHAHLAIRRDADVTPSWELTIDDVMEARVETAESLLVSLVQAINARAIKSWPGVVCHAGGVAWEGAGVLLPADPESGKSTLTAGLVRAGFDYLTDEAVAFRRGENMIEPYPKPLSLDPGSWHLFPELEPNADLANDDYKQLQWQVPPTAIRADAVGRPCPARYLVFPEYVEGAKTELVGLGRAEALVELAKNTFAFNERSRFALEELAGIVRQVDCYRLTAGDLDEAVARITELVG
jgi:hypothetical protein